MPEVARLDAPGILDHAIIRSIERHKILRDNHDREEFLGRLQHLSLETKTACYAWVLMPNHTHFLFRTGDVPLATLMRRLLTGYAVSFNQRHRRSCQGSLTVVTAFLWGEKRGPGRIRNMYFPILGVI